jgi:hypothetical protein
MPIVTTAYWAKLVPAHHGWSACTHGRQLHDDSPHASTASKQTTPLASGADYQLPKLPNSWMAVHPVLSHAEWCCHIARTVLLEALSKADAQP